MDLKIKDQLFLVGGASSGLGKAISERLLQEGANILAIARRGSELRALAEKYPGKVKYLAADISSEETIGKIREINEPGGFSGIVLNAGGPPAMKFMETTAEVWDEAYHLLVRWKIQIVKLFLPEFMKRGYGKFLFIESVSIKQPVDNLILSNSFRMAIAGMVKTISKEVSEYGITLNILAPGYHETPAIQRLFKKKSELTGMGYNESREEFIQDIPVRSLGNPDDFATIAAWLLSPLSRYVTGQNFFIDGGVIRSSV
jgi:3-oxoacyl-[acyl-carrier protein] reductase